MSQNPRYNLVDEAWIPVLFLDGSHDVLGLEKLFYLAEEIADLAVRPHERIALMRLLLCLCYVAYRQRTENGEPQWGIPDWENLGTYIESYLKTWKKQFYLFHPSCPFLQLANLTLREEKGKKKEPTALSKLDCTRATGNNHTLFDHMGEQCQMRSSELAMSLLTWQCFSLGGRISYPLWNGKQIYNKSAVDAPCVRQSMLHVLIRGRNLLETLRLNFVSVKNLAYLFTPFNSYGMGKPVWENMPSSIDDTEAVTNATSTFLGRLVPLSRAVLLREQDMIYGEALQYPDYVEPTATSYLEKKKNQGGLKLISYKPDKAVWRELPAVLAAIHNTSNSPYERGPLALTSLNSQDAEEWEYELLTVGVARNQAKYLDIAESVYPLRKALLTDDGRQSYEGGVAAAEEKSEQLKIAVNCFRKHLGVNEENNSQLLEQALLAFWNKVELNLATLFEMATSIEDGDRYQKLSMEWNNKLHHLALLVYDLVCGELSARHEQAYVLGRRRISTKKILEKR